MIIEILGTGIIAGIVVGGALLLFGKPVLRRIAEKVTEDVLTMSEKRYESERQRLAEQRQADQELIDEKRRAIDRSSEQTQKSVEEVVGRLMQAVEKGQQQLHDSDKARDSSFGAIKTALEEYKQITGELKVSTDDLKRVLSNNQLRGKYGQEVAENLLKTIGFVIGQHYTKEEAMDSTATRPDFTVLLPDGQKINIDVKFPLQSLQRFQDAEDTEEKKRHFNQFKQDVKQKVKEVTSRDYVNPEEGTVDFVILFVPNEMIFSVIYDSFNDVWNDAFKKKVIMAGPFSFTAILRMVFQSYKSFSYQENIREIVKHIKVFEKEWGKFSEELATLGKRLQSTSKQYELVSTTRSNQLAKVVEKIQGEGQESIDASAAPELISGSEVLLQESDPESSKEVVS